MSIVILASGYGLIEGPRVDASNRLYFSDVHKGGVYRRSADGTIKTIVPRRRGVGGIALHADGGVVISGRNVCHVDSEGQTRVLLERDDIPGFNDLFCDREGRIYVGALRSDPFGNDAGGKTGELWRISGPDQAEELYGGIRLSNGIGFSPDGRLLYHSDTVPQAILVHELTPEGEAKHRRVLVKLDSGAPDGLAVDAEGCIWVAVYGGGCAARYTPTGELERRIEVPATAVTSLCFGGSDLRDLYIVTADNTEDATLGGTVFRTRVDTPGLPVPLARV